MKYKDFLKNLDRNLLVALVFLLPFERIPSLDAFGVTLRMSFAVAGLIILRAIWLIFSRRAELPKIGPTRATLLAFLIWVAISVFTAINLNRAFQVVIFTFFTVFTALAVSVVYKKDHLACITKSLIISATLVGLFGAYQYIGNLAGLPDWATGLRERYSWQVFGFPRIQSVALEPLYYSSYLLLPLSVVASRILLVGNRMKQNLILALFFMTSIFLTVSRGGIVAMVGMAILLSVYGFVLRRTSIKQVVALISFVALSYLLSFLIITYLAKPPVNQAVTGGKKGAVVYTKQLQTTGLEAGGDERAIIRGQALGLLNEDKTRYIAGIGAGQFGPYVQGKDGGEGGWFIVNNEPIELLLEYGLIGLSLFAVFAVSLALRSMRFIKNPADESSGVIAFALLGYMFATAIQYQTFSTLYIMHIWVAIGLLLAISLRVDERVR